MNQDKLTPELDAARRLGVLPSFVDSMTLPPEALADPERHIIVNDGRECHDGTLCVWLAKRAPFGRFKVLGRVCQIPRHSPSQPTIYKSASDNGIKLLVIDRPGIPHVRLPRLAIKGEAPPDLTGITLYPTNPK